MLCDVCGSNSKSSCVHFGAKSCKACAAFFRRTVALKLEYACIKDKDSCRVHYDSKVICRYCRVQKCYKVGMIAALVQSKNERKNYIRMSRGLVKKQESKGNDEESNEIEEEEREREITKDVHNVNLNDRSSEIPGCSTPTVTIEQSVLSQFISLEIALNDRRRLLYGETQIRNVFAEPTSCPYDRKSLRMYDYKSSQGMSKQDFVIIMDYARVLPGFESLNYPDKNFCYRLICAVDFVMSSAFYTYKCGFQDNLLVLCDGSFIPMVPEPMKGTEENAHRFENPDDLFKYRTMMSLMTSQWKMCHPFAELELTFEEFVLLKGICIWHVSFYRLSQTGRDVARSQRDSLMKALYYACGKKSSNVEERFGSVILGLNYVMEQIRNVNCSFVLISFFGILNVDSLMLDVTSFW